MDTAEQDYRSMMNLSKQFLKVIKDMLDSFMDLLMNRSRFAAQIAFAKAAFDEMCGVLGLLYQKKENEIPQEILDLVEERAAARKAKDFAKADALRDQITTMGYIVEETRQGTKISKK